MRVGSLCTGCGGLDVAVHAVLGAQLMFTTEPDRHPTPSSCFPQAFNLGNITRGGRLHDLCTDLDGNLATTRTGLWFDAARDDRALPPPPARHGQRGRDRPPARGQDVCSASRPGGVRPVVVCCLHAADE